MSFYAVDGFGQGNDGLGGWGFSIRLDSGFAKKLYDSKIPKEQIERFDERGKSIIRNIWREEEASMIDRPYSLFRDIVGEETFLLQYCQVPGNACDLGVEGMDLERLKEYFEKGDYLKNLVSEIPVVFTPHNVDCFQQASGLFAIWNNWYQIANYLTRKED